MTSYGFKDAVKLGNLGALAVAKYFESMPACSKVHVHGNDLVLTMGNKRQITCSVKTDYTKFANIFVETISVVENKAPGWLYTCTSEYIAYYYVKTGKMFMINTAKLRHWLTDAVYEKYPTASTKSNNGSWTTLGKKVPITELLLNIPTVKEFSI